MSDTNLPPLTPLEAGTLSAIRDGRFSMGELRKRDRATVGRLVRKGYAVMSIDGWCPRANEAGERFLDDQKLTDQKDEET